MKNLVIVLVCFVLSMQNIFSQEKYSFGINISTGFSNINNSLYDYDYKVCYSIRTNVEYILNKYFSANVNIGYERKGAKINDKIFTDILGIETYSADIMYNYDYLTFPVYARYRTNGNVQFVIDIGPNLGYLVSQKNKITPAVDPSVLSDTENSKNMNRIDVGLYSGIGICVALNSRIKFDYGIKGTYGLLNTSKNLPYSGLVNNIYSIDFKFGISYML